MSPAVENVVGIAIILQLVTTTDGIEIEHLKEIRTNKQKMKMCRCILHLLFLITLSTTSCAIQLDLHLKLSSKSCLYQTALAANQNLHKQSSSELISFNDTSPTTTTTTTTGGLRVPVATLPHVTLYLTDFRNDSIAEVIKSLQGLNNLNIVNVESSDPIVNGPYAMYSILTSTTSPALQSLSDTIVQHTSQYIKPNQTIPEWVYNLPEPSRSRKIDYVDKYGSPNVFKEFEPHLTVGYDEIASVDERIQVLSLYGGCRDVVWEIGVGVVGDWGTVDYDLVVIDLKEGVEVDEAEAEAEAEAEEDRWEDENGHGQYEHFSDRLKLRGNASASIEKE